MLIAKEEEIAALRLQLEKMVRQRPTDLSGIAEADSRAEVSSDMGEMWFKTCGIDGVRYPAGHGIARYASP
jgi:hypothetical protein